MLPQALFLLGCAVQCSDPPLPPGGFSYFESFDEEVTFTDGETTTAVARWPSTEPAQCGWPVLVFVHGLFGSKSAVAHLGRNFADAGYFTLTFDVRGHATSTGDHTLWGLRERLDVVELLQWAQASYPGLIDAQRIGLGGTSQGAILSFSVAAWGGRQIPPNPWIDGVFPEIDAIVVENLTTDFLSTFAPQSVGIHTNVAAALITENIVRFDPGLIDDALHALLDEDYAEWAAIVADSSRDPAPLVPTMTTSVLAMSAWDDFWFPVAPLIDVVDMLPAGVARKIYVGAGGHSSPANEIERLARVTWRREWFDHFLKGVNNGVEVGPAITYAITPADTATYLDLNSTWERGSTAVWPPPDTRGYRLFLRENGHLWPFEPTSAETTETLVQDVSPAYSMNDIVAAGFRLPGIEAEIPRRRLDWDSSRLIAPLKFVGDPIMRLAVVPEEPRWQVGVSLWDVAPNGEERYVTSGSYFAHDQFAVGSPVSIDVRLGSQAYTFPADHRVRVRLENLHVHEPPVGSILRYGPTLTSFELAVHHQPAASSWLELPVFEGDSIPYGWSQIASNGCIAVVTTEGTASATAPAPFEIRAADITSERDGVVIYGFGPRKTFLNGGYLFVQGPIRRGPIQHSGGSGANDCSGAFAYDFNERIRSGLDPALIPGARVFAQYWLRDPAAIAATNLTNAVEFSVFP